MVTDSHISDDDYEHAQKVFDTFNLWKMRAYNKIYMLRMELPFSPNKPADFKAL